MHGVKKAMIGRNYNDVTVDYLNVAVRQSIRENLDTKRYPQDAIFQCYGAAKTTDNLKDDLSQVDRVLVLANHTKNKKITGMAKSMQNLIEYVVSNCNTTKMSMVVITNDSHVRESLRLKSWKIEVYEPSNETITKEIERITENAGGSLIATICHGERVVDTREDDGLAGVILFDDQKISDDILRDSIKNFKGKVYVGLYEHCYPMELGDQGVGWAQAKEACKKALTNTVKKTGRRVINTTVGTAKLCAKATMSTARISKNIAVVCERSVTTNNWGMFMSPIIFGLTSMLKWMAPTIIATIPDMTLMTPYMLSILCTVLPVVICGLMIIWQRYSCIVTEALVPVMMQVVVMFLNKGTLTDIMVSSTPISILACLFLSICSNIRTYRIHRRKRTWMSAASIMLMQGESLIKAYDVLVSGIYTDIGSNMTNMANFTNGFTVYYFPKTRVDTISNLTECLIPSYRKDGVLIHNRMQNATRYTIKNDRLLATCDHDIFSKEVRRNLNGTAEFPFGNLEKFIIGNVTVHMDVFNTTRKQYFHALGVYKGVNTNELDNIRTAKWMEDDVKSIQFHNQGEWVDPEDSWHTSLIGLVRQFVPI